jgi:hypothetical protein
MKLDSSRSRLAVYTFAEGFLSALAHDLEIVGHDLSGESNGADTAEVRVKVSGLKVSGAVKRGKLDANALSPSDRATVERQIREEVLPGAEVVARGTLSGGRASIEVTAPRGTTKVACDAQVSAEAEGKRAKGTVEVALSAIGAPQVKGPMGAFRLKDRVRVEFDLLFVP